MIDVEDVEAYTLQDVAETFEPQVEEWIEQMTAYIERVTNRTFGSDTTASERKYDGTGSVVLLVDDYTELDSVEVDGSVRGDVYEYPANTTPKYKIVSNTPFPRGHQNITVTANWGYGNAPKDLQFACTVLVAGIINAQTKTNDKASESIGNYSVSYKTDAQQKDYEQAMKTIHSYRVHPL
jgi:hypothetical protein